MLNQIWNRLVVKLDCAKNPVGGHWQRHDIVKHKTRQWRNLAIIEKCILI